MPRQKKPPAIPNDRIIAEVREYSDFLAALRGWIYELDTNYTCINELGGLEDNYLHKLLARTPARNFGRLSLGITLATLGLKLLVVVDGERLAKMRPRYSRRKKHASDDASDGSPRSMRFNKNLAAIFARRRAALQSPERRREIARNAAHQRWAHHQGRS
jgi:hypothetical protein